QQIGVERRIAAGDTLRHGGFDPRATTMLCCQIALRLRDARLVSNAATFMRLLASTAAATHNSKRSWPSARQRFMPRPRNRTEMRPSMPARKRCPALKSALFSYASRSGVLDRKSVVEG